MLYLGGDSEFIGILVLSAQFCCEYKLTLKNSRYESNAVTHLFNKDLLSTYYEPGTNIVLWISVVSTKNSQKCPPSWSLYCGGGRRTINR